MSLINKVLRDLEARERGEQTPPKRPVLDDLRPASESADRRSGGFLRIFGVVLGLTVIAAATWWSMSLSHVTGAPSIPAAGLPQASHVPSVARVTAPAARPPRAHLARASRPAPRSFAPSTKVMVAAAPVSAVRRLAARPHFVFRSQGTAISRRRAPLTALERAQAAYRHAVQALQAGHAGQARAACKVALRLNPKALPPALLLATLDLQGARLREAHDVLRAALEKHPQALPAAMLLAQVDLRRGQPASAAHTLAGLRVVGAGSRSYWALLAVSQWRAGDQAAAHATYRSALRRFPHDGPLWVGLGLIDSRAGQAARADRAFRHAAACPLPPVLARFVQARIHAFHGTHQNR